MRLWHVIHQDVQAQDRTRAVWVQDLEAKFEASGLVSIVDIPKGA